MSMPTPFRHFSFTVGLRKQRDYFVENLSLLIAGGMPIISAFDTIATELRSRRMRGIIATIQAEIEAGSSLWRALSSSNLFPDHAISLIRLGEESGKLIENLQVIAIEQEKNRILKSKIRSAMMYPVFVLGLTVIIGIGIAWFILPKLALVFAQLKIELPLITTVLIATGIFLGEYGQYAVPIMIAIFVGICWLIFSYSKTKFIGQFILFSLPGIRRLMTEVEMARFGYVMGTLLEAGLPINHALQSLASATEMTAYKKLYTYLHHAIEDGNSIQNSFATCTGINKLMPIAVQQLIIVSEQSGMLSSTLLKIGHTFEIKADTSTKNITTIIEPLLLIIVWLGVVAVALAVILPMYSLIGNFNTQ